MDLNFNILIIDDNQEFIEEKMEFIQVELGAKGLGLIYQPYTSYDEFLNLLTSSPNTYLQNYDLILIDYKLVDNSENQGDFLIEKIRDLQIFTTIFFYSINGEKALQKIISERQIEGVFCADKSTIFNDKIIKIINYLIKRIQDINFLRGFVIAEISDLDVSMKNILINLLTNKFFPESNHSHRNTLIKKEEKSLNDKLNALTSIDIAKIENYIKFLSSDLLIRGLDRLSKALSAENNKSNIENGVINIFKENQINTVDYQAKILMFRNKLAHVNAELKDDKTILVNYLDDIEQVIEDNDFISVRNDIRNYKNLFTKISDFLKSIPNQIDG